MFKILPDEKIIETSEMKEMYKGYAYLYEMAPEDDKGYSMGKVIAVATAEDIPQLVAYEHEQEKDNLVFGVSNTSNTMVRLVGMEIA